MEGALKYAMNEFQSLAEHIDSHKNYHIDPYKKFDAAQKKVLMFQGEIGAELDAAVKDFKSGKSDGSGKSGDSV